MHTEPHAFAQFRSFFFPVVGAVALVAFLLSAIGANVEVNRVTFPSNLDRLVHCTTVKRGEVNRPKPLVKDPSCNT